MVLEYVPSIKFSQISGERAKLFMSTSHIKGRERLLDLGIIIATDTLLNYSNRFPTLWDTPKVIPDSLLVSYNPLKIPSAMLLDNKHDPNIEIFDLYCINTRCNSYKNPMDSIAYLNRLEKFINSVCEDLKKLQKEEVDIKEFSFDSIIPIRNALNKWFNAEPPALGYLEILLGIMVGYYNISNMGFDRLRRIFVNVKAFALKVNQQEWESELEEEVKLDFLREIVELISYHLMNNVDIVAWVLKVVNGKRVIENFEGGNEDSEVAELEIDPTFDLDAKLKKEEEERIKKMEEEEAEMRERFEEEMKQRAEILLSAPEDEVVEIAKEEKEEQEVKKEEKEEVVPEKDIRGQGKSCCCTVI